MLIVNVCNISTVEIIRFQQQNHVTSETGTSKLQTDLFFKMLLDFKSMSTYKFLDGSYLYGKAKNILVLYYPIYNNFLN